MEFHTFNILLGKSFNKITKNADKLYVMDVDKDVLWNTYLCSFPPGTNEIFRERREFDCSCCRQFVKNFGNVVAIIDGELKSIWDFQTDDDKFQPVINALASLVKSKPIRNVLVTKDSKFGTLKSYESKDNGDVITWDHFQLTLDKKFVFRGAKTEIGETLGQYRDTRNVLERSFNEISEEALSVVLELISQNSLYKGNEWKSNLETFSRLRREYFAITDPAQSIQANKRDVFCWTKSAEVGPVIGRIKNHSIGVLLSNLTSGMDLDEAVRKYEAIVAPINYKRPKAIFTKKMIEEAEKLLTKEGLIDSLPRRFATLGDITVNNILFANRDAVKKMSGSVFDEMKEEAETKPKKLGKVEEVSIEKFIKDILPEAESVELLLENKHCGNFVSLIAPQNKEAKPLFKWDNGFSWAYAGNITDSMKERVKSAGGNVEGVLRFSIQWNTDGDNQNDFDAHCKEPGGNLIYYGSKINYNTLGNLDVDIIHPKGVAVENITWPSLSKMEDGVYTLMVHNFSHRGGTSGFQAEIEFDGNILSFDYPRDIYQGGKVEVAKVKLTKGVFEVISSLDSTTASKQVWGLKTNEFHPISVCMLSPNYWNEQSGIGNKHFFFMLKSCTNDGTPNGFFNEFLREDTMKHKRVFEALGSKMKVTPTDDQLSGLGFSDTKRSSVTLRVKGSFTRTLVVNI